MMTPRAIIAKAWVITKSRKSLRRWGFVSAMFETLLSIKLLIYQVWFFYSYFIQKEPISPFTIEKLIFDTMPMWLFFSVLIFFIVLLILELFIPHFATGAIIGLAAKAHRKEEVKGGLVLGIYNFFPLFAIHEFFVFAGLSTCITLLSIILRYGSGFKGPALAILFTAFLLSNLFKFFTMFAEEAVVIRKMRIGEAMKKSFKMVISYIGHIVFLVLLMLVIVLRIVANAAIVFIIPGIVIGIVYLLMQFLPAAVAFLTGIGVGFVVAAFASYFFAYLEVFRQTVWTITFMELSQLKELDVIEAEEGAEAPPPPAVESGHDH